MTTDSSNQKHIPKLIPVMGDKYEDDDAADYSDWDGTTRLSCTCGWRDSRITISLDFLVTAWRDHATADTYGLGFRGRTDTA